MGSDEVNRAVLRDELMKMDDKALVEFLTSILTGAQARAIFQNLCDSKERTTIFGHWSGAKRPTKTPLNCSKTSEFTPSNRVLCVHSRKPLVYLEILTCSQFTRKN